MGESTASCGSSFRCLTASEESLLVGFEPSKVSGEGPRELLPCGVSSFLVGV